MTSAQRQHFYFPAWRLCAQARGWVQVKGRFAADLAAQRLQPIPSPACEEMLKVIDLSESFANDAHRAVTADDLRHACNHVASQGKTVHTEAMDNHATTMAVRLFRLLADPDDLSAVMEWLDPEEADRRDYVRWMKTAAAEGALAAIARNAWGTSDWESQPMPELRWLARTACRRSERRRGSFRRTIELSEVPQENQPF